MNLRLAIRSKKERIEAEAKPFSIHMKDGAFAVVAPMFDDWTQTVKFDLRSADAVIRADAFGLIIEFPDEGRMKRFQSWLAEANAKAEHGYKTMWP